MTQRMPKRMMTMALALSCGMPTLSLARPQIKPAVIRTEGTPRQLSGPRIEIRIYLPEGRNPASIDVLNQTMDHLGLVQFELRVFGGQGQFSFSELAPGSRQRNQLTFPSIQNLTIDNIVVFDRNATEKWPRTVIQLIAPEHSAPAAHGGAKNIVQPNRRTAAWTPATK
jgi:hypothetical protein